MRLREYLNKAVLLIDQDKEEWRGTIERFIPSIDSETGEDQIVLSTEEGTIGFAASEILSLTEEA
jgi:hypothetical protein